MLSQGDANFFAANPKRRYRIREHERTGHRRHMCIVDREGRETIFPVGEDFAPLDTDAELSSLARLHQLRGLGDAKILKSLGHSPKGRHYRG
jgi:hypothetical protein